MKKANPVVDLVRQNQAEEEAETPYDTSDPEQVNHKRKKSARTRAERLEFVKAAMQHPQGRAWFYDTMLRAKVFNNPYMNTDPYATAFRCGELNIGLQILDDVQTAAPDKYITMISENKTKNG